MRTLSPLAFAVVLLLATLAGGCAGASDVDGGESASETSTSEAPDAASAEEPSTVSLSYVDDMAAAHEGDAPEPSPLVRTPEAAISSGSVTYKTTDDGDVWNGHYAGLDDDDHWKPAVVLIHEWWGLNENIRRMAEQIASRGYQVLAVDLYEGAITSDPERAASLMQNAMDRPEVLHAHLQAAREYLSETRNAPRVAVMGWCFGGHWALQAALEAPDSWDGTVIYYGSVEEADEEAVAALNMPVLGIFGGADESIPVPTVEAFADQLERGNVPADIRIYEGADHAFASPSGARYAPKAAEDAWERTLAFLDSTLRAGK